MPPGTVGQYQLTRGGPLRGYFQPVEIVPPKGGSISLLVNGKFQRPKKHSVKVGMLIGQVYRIKITGIPGHPGVEAYPTIEVINRLYAPGGQATRHPIPVHVAISDLKYALSGRFVARVIYLEDANNPFPHAEDPERQRYFEVGATQDPLQVADELGRPMAILRIGSRIPHQGDIPSEFAFGSPPLIQFPSVRPAEPLPKIDAAPQPEPVAEPQVNLSTPQVRQAAWKTPADWSKHSAQQAAASSRPVQEHGPPRFRPVPAEASRAPAPLTAEFLPIRSSEAVAKVAPAQPARNSAFKPQDRHIDPWKESRPRDATADAAVRAKKSASKKKVTSGSFKPALPGRLFQLPYTK